MLNDYIAQTQSLLDDPSAVEYTTADLTNYINDARIQIAGSSESLRDLGTLALVGSQQNYQFPNVVLVGGAPGLGGVLDVRMAALVGGNQVAMRSWEWFFSYYVAIPVRPTGIPTVAAVLTPGIAGTIWFAPIPNAAMSALLDAVWYPIPLIDDTTPEALAVPWQDAVPYFAAYLAYLNAQRRTDADAMYNRYEIFERRATQMTTPTRLPRNYPGNKGARQAGRNMPITAPAQTGGQTGAE